MSIDRVSVKKAIKNVASPFYDKKNIFYYFVISFLVSLLSYFIPEKPTSEQLPITLLLGLIVFVLSIVLNGFYMVALNNSIHRREGVFPNPIANLSKILLVALSSYVGNFVWILVMILVTCLFMIPLIIAQQYILAILISSIPLLILATFYIGACFNFSVSLEIVDWFNVKQSWVFMKKAGPNFLEYLLKSIFLYICGLILFIIVFMIYSPLALLLQEPVLTGVSGVYLFFMSMIIVIIATYLLDLTAQFIRKSIGLNKQVCE